MSYNWIPEHNITELNRTTVSDGSILNSGTFKVLGTRDEYLLSLANIENTGLDNIYSFLQTNSAKMDNNNLSSFSAVNVYGDKLIGDSGLSGELRFSANCLSFNKSDDDKIHINLLSGMIENNISSYYNNASATSLTYLEPSDIKNSVAFRTNCLAGNNSLVMGKKTSATNNSIAMVYDDTSGSYSNNNSFILGTHVNYLADDNSIGLFSNCTAVHYSIAIKGASATNHSIAYGDDFTYSTGTSAENYSINILALNGIASDSSFCFSRNTSAYDKSFSFNNSVADMSTYAFHHSTGINESIAYYFSTAYSLSISVQNSTADWLALAFAGSSAINGIAYNYSSADSLGIAYSNSEAHGESISLYNSKATSSSRGIAIRESFINDDFNIAINQSTAVSGSIGISDSMATDNSLAISNNIESGPFNIESHDKSIALLDSSYASNHSVAIINSTGTNYSLSFLNSLSTEHSVAFNSSSAHNYSISDTRSFAGSSSYASIESSAYSNSLSLYNSTANNSSVALWNSSAKSDVKLDKNGTSYPLYNISLWDNSLRINSDGFINDILIKIANGLLNDPILSATYLIG